MNIKVAAFTVSEKSINISSDEMLHKVVFHQALFAKNNPLGQK